MYKLVLLRQVLILDSKDPLPGKIVKFQKSQTASSRNRKYRGAEKALVQGGETQRMFILEKL